MLLDIVEEHADEAAFLCRLREQAILSWRYDLSALLDLDRRLQAHIDGLVCAGPAAWQVCHRKLSGHTQPEVFVSACVLARLSLHDELNQFVAESLLAADGRYGLLTAFGWLEWDIIAARLEAYLESGDAQLQAFALDVASEHRGDIGRRFERFLQPQDPVLTPSVLRYAGRMGRVNALPFCLSKVEESEPATRRVAAEAVLLLGGPSVPIRMGDISSDPERDDRMLLGLVENRDMMIEYAQDALRSGAHAFSGLIISASAGSPELVPALMELLREARLARPALMAMSQSFGVDPDQVAAADPIEFWSQDDVVAAETAHPAHADWPWPDPGKLENWWAQHCGAFPHQHWWQMGRPFAADQFLDILAVGIQPVRQLASLHRARRKPEEILFNWRAPAVRQRFQINEMQG